MKAIELQKKALEGKGFIPEWCTVAEEVDMLFLVFSDRATAVYFCENKLRYMLQPSLMADLLTGKPIVVIYKYDK